MSYEMKDILKTMIANNEPHWSADTLDMARVELDHVYSQAAKADEYEAKAEAFDEIVEKYEGIMKEVRNRKFKVTSDVTLLGLEAEKVIKKYESGEYDA